MVAVTKHGAQRVRERLGLPKKTVERLAARALEEGAPHNAFAGGIKRYLDKVFLDHHNATNMRVLNGYLFLFNDQTLITCWALPPKYRKAKAGGES